MPIQSDQSKPIPTVDATGKVLSTPNEIKTFTLQGREIAANPQPKAEPVNINLNEQAIPEGSQQTQAEPQQETKTNSEAEARKLFLQAQKAERKAKEMEKKAAENLKKATAIEQAVELAKSGKDPIALIRAAGLNEAEFFKTLTDYGLSPEYKEKYNPTAEDPVQKELREHRERLDKYAKDLELQANTIKQKEEIATHNTVIAKDVIPLLQNNPDKYEALLAEYGPNAAVQVYNTLWEYYQEKGHINDDAGIPLTFERVADTLEDFWATQIETGLNAASKLKKFKSKFAQQASETRNLSSNDQQETPNRSFTLSNKQTVSPVSTKNLYKGLSTEERWEEIKKRHGA